MSQTICSDGRVFVYGVFGADGCECENLEKIFGDESSAMRYLEHLRLQSSLGDGENIGPNEEYLFYGKPEFLEVRCLEVQP